MAPLAELRQSLRDARHALFAGYAAAPATRSFLRGHSRLVDRFVRELWDSAGLPSDCALLAVGGYGRAELFPYSDVDLLILVPAHTASAPEEAIAQFVRNLWDIGIELGHSVRTVAQCDEEASKDVTVATALLEARRISGSLALFRVFDRVVRQRTDAEGFMRAKRLEQAQRHEKFHNTPFSLEPNLKEGPGALRDIHVVRWVCAAQRLGHRWRDLAESGLLTLAESRQIARLEVFLSDVRIRLHLLAGRREDRLLFEYQAGLATQFGVRAEGSRRASERFMQRYYRSIKLIAQLNTIVLQNLRSVGALAEYSPARVIDEHFQVVHDLLDVRDEDVFQNAPHAILEGFLWLQRDASLQGMSARTLRSLWRARQRIDPRFRANPANRTLFLQLLKSPRGIVHELRRMNQYDILGRYLPAFGRIVGQMQHDLFHVYTVDQHILMVVRNLRRFTMVEFSHEYPECSRLIANFDRHWLLYLAAIFHDIAKGRGGDHSKLGRVDAERFCRLHRLPEDEAALVCFLVEQHLTMSAVAQKSDLTDPRVITAFASTVGTERNLVALYLFTIADIRGTSPKVWNGWKAKLLEDLYRLTLRVLQHGEPSYDRDVEHKQAEALRLIRLQALPDSAKDLLWRQLDVSYFLRHDAKEIAWHAGSLHYRVDAHESVVCARLAEFGEGIQTLIYTRDQRDLFARICGFFDSIRFSIVEAKIHTTRHGYALDSFHVLSPEPDPSYREMMARIEYELPRQLAAGTPLRPPSRGRISRQLAQFPIEPQVRIQPDERGKYWSLSVIAGDRPGLLHAIAATFNKYGINIHAARVNTLGERAEDVFVIDGEILFNPRSMLSLETELVETLR